MDEQIEHEENDVQSENSASQINQTPPVGLDRNRKIAVAVLGLVAFVLIIFWSKNLQFQLNDPFTYKGGDDKEVVVDDDSDTALRLKDTDNDGLNDYDELNVYMTSPYLDDTDSDGFKDGEEIANGNNPNCAAGAECEVVDPLEGATNSTGDVDTSTSLMADILADVDMSSVSAEEIKAVREAFIESGYDKAKLDALTDKEVYQIYLVSIQTYANNKESGIEAQTEETKISSDDATAIRTAYEKAGYKKEDLDKISDEDLIKAYKEALNTYENNPSSGGVN